MGADHTCGVTSSKGQINVGTSKFTQMYVSRLMQVMCAAADSCMCIMGFLVSMKRLDLSAKLLAYMYGTDINMQAFPGIGTKTLMTERAFNSAAGFTAEDDRLPAYFYTERAKSTGAVFDFTDDEVQNLYQFV